MSFLLQFLLLLLFTFFVLKIASFLHVRVILLFIIGIFLYHFITGVYHWFAKCTNCEEDVTTFVTRFSRSVFGVGIESRVFTCPGSLLWIPSQLHKPRTPTRIAHLATFVHARSVVHDTCFPDAESRLAWFWDLHGHSNINPYRLYTHKSQSCRLRARNPGPRQYCCCLLPDKSICLIPRQWLLCLSTFPDRGLALPQVQLPDNGTLFLLARFHC